MNNFGLVAEIQLQMGPQAEGVLRKIRSSIEGSLNLSTTAASQSFDNLAKSTQRANQATATFGGLSRTTLANIDATTRSVKSATGSLEEFAKMSGLAIRRYSGFVLTTSATFGLLRAMQGAISDAIEFEKQMVRIAQTSEKTLTAVGSVGKEISRISMKWGADSKELANVGVILAQAGYSASETQSMLEALGKTTLAATFGNINSTTEGLIAILNQFNLKASETERILSEVNVVAARYAVEADDIVEAVKRGGAAFAAAGGNLEEFMALFTAVRSTTRESAESIATGMRTIFTRIQRGSTIAMLEELGIKLRDVNGQFIGPLRAMEEINRVMSRVPSTSGLFSAVAEEIGGYRQMSKTIPLIQQIAKAHEVYNVAISGGNSLTKDAELAQQALWVQIKKVKEEFLDLFRTISQDTIFKATIQFVLQMTSGIIAMTKAIAPLLPLLMTYGLAMGSVFLSKRGPALWQSFTSPWRGHSGGGYINQGGGSVDDVPAMLTKGEYVLKKSAVSAIGIGTLDKINKFAAGGLVGPNRHFYGTPPSGDSTGERIVSILQRILDVEHRQLNLFSNNFVGQQKVMGFMEGAEVPSATGRQQTKEFYKKYRDGLLELSKEDMQTDAAKLSRLDRVRNFRKQKINEVDLLGEGSFVNQTRSLVYGKVPSGLSNVGIDIFSGKSTYSDNRQPIYNKRSVPSYIYPELPYARTPFGLRSKSSPWSTEQMVIGNIPGRSFIPLQTERFLREGGSYNQVQSTWNPKTEQSLQNRYFPTFSSYASKIGGMYNGAVGAVGSRLLQAGKGVAFSPAGAIAASILGNNMAQSENKTISMTGSIMTGAAGGAAIGSMLLPGWGTAIGAFVGGITAATSSLKDFEEKIKKTAISEYQKTTANLGAKSNVEALGTQMDAIYKLASDIQPEYTERRMASPSYMGAGGTVVDVPIRVTGDNIADTRKKLEEYAGGFDTVDKNLIVEQIGKVGLEKFRGMKTKENYESTLMALGAKEVNVDRLGLTGKTLEQAFIIWSDAALKAGEKLVKANVNLVKFRESLDGLSIILNGITEGTSRAVDSYKESGERRRFINQGVFGTGLQTQVSQASALALANPDDPNFNLALNSVNNWAYGGTGSRSINMRRGQTADLFAQTAILREGLPSIIGAATGDVNGPGKIDEVIKTTFKGRVNRELLDNVGTALKQEMSGGGGRESVLKSFTGDPRKLTESVLERTVGGAIRADTIKLNEERLRKAQIDLDNYVEELNNNRRIREVLTTGDQIGFQSAAEARQRAYARGEVGTASIGRFQAGMQDRRNLNYILPEAGGAFDLGSLQSYGGDLQRQMSMLAENKKAGIINPEQEGEARAQLTDKTQRYMQVLQKLTQGTEQLNDAQKRLSELTQQEQANKDYTLRYLSGGAGERRKIERDFGRMSSDLGMGFGNLSASRQSRSLQTLQSLPQGFMIGGKTREQWLEEISTQHVPAFARGNFAATTRNRRGTEDEIAGLQANQAKAAELTASMMKEAVGLMQKLNSADNQKFQKEMSERIIESNKLFDTSTQRFQSAVSDFSKAAASIPSQIDKTDNRGGIQTKTTYNLRRKNSQPEDTAPGIGVV